MKVLGIGEIVLDRTIQVDEYPIEGSKVKPNKVEHSVGGPVAAGLILLSKLGVEATMVATLGSDENGEILKKKLSEAGVRLIPIIKKRTKNHIVIVNGENGSRTIIKDNVRNPLIKSISLELLKDVDAVIFDRHEPLAFDFVVKNKSDKTKIIVDPSDEVSMKTLKMMQESEIPIIPIETLYKVRRHESLRANLDSLFQKLGKNIIVTAGKYGSLIFDGENIKHFPPYDVNVVDTLGAGDVFRGAFAYGIINGWEIGRIIDYSNMVSGLQCTKIGNSSAIPNKADIEIGMQTINKRDIQLNLLN
jgi:sulfofructose kinase